MNVVNKSCLLCPSIFAGCFSKGKLSIRTITLCISLESIKISSRQQQINILRCQINCHMLMKIAGLMEKATFIKLESFYCSLKKGQ